MKVLVRVPIAVVKYLGPKQVQKERVQFDYISTSLFTIKEIRARTQGRDLNGGRSRGRDLKAV